MSAPTGLVLAASAVVSSPIAWLFHEGSISPETAVQRWMVCMALCWVAISVVSSLAYPAPRLAGTDTPAPPSAPPLGTASEERPGQLT